jgi:hypothetical protein
MFLQNDAGIVCRNTDLFTLVLVLLDAHYFVTIATTIFTANSMNNDTTTNIFSFIFTVTLAITIVGLFFLLLLLLFVFSHVTGTSHISSSTSRMLIYTGAILTWTRSTVVSKMVVKEVNNILGSNANGNSLGRISMRNMADMFLLITTSIVTARTKHNIAIIHCLISTDISAVTGLGLAATSARLGTTARLAIISTVHGSGGGVAVRLAIIITVHGR